MTKPQVFLLDVNSNDKAMGSSKKGTQDPAKDNGRNTNEGKPSAEVGSAKPGNQDPVRTNGGGQQYNAPAHTNAGQPRRTMIATWEEVEMVKNLIGNCMNMYLNRDKVVEVLRLRSRIDPRLTLLVWRKLEQDNPDFFRAYHRRVALCAQIETFNRLLRKQSELMDAQRPCLGASVISQAEFTASNLNFLPGPVSYSGNNTSYDNSPASVDISEDSGNDLDSLVHSLDHILIQVPRLRHKAILQLQGKVIPFNGSSGSQDYGKLFSSKYTGSTIIKLGPFFELMIDDCKF